MLKEGFKTSVKKYFLKEENLLTASLRGISIISIALLIFISGSGIKLSMHFCQHQLYDIGILSHAKSCMQDATHKHNHCCKEKEKSHSCEDDNIVFKKVDNYLITSISFDYHTYLNTLFAVFESHNFNEFPLANPNTKRTYLEDISPPDMGTILAELQVYRL